MKPTNLPDTLRHLKNKPLFRMSRLEGQRTWLFLPFAVVRRFRGHHAALLRLEVANARSAAKTPFFGALAVRQRRIARGMSVSWRYRRVQIADYEDIAAIVEDRLKAAAAARREPLVA